AVHDGRVEVRTSGDAADAPDVVRDAASRQPSPSGSSKGHAWSTSATHTLDSQVATYAGGVRAGPARLAPTAAALASRYSVLQGSRDYQATVTDGLVTGSPLGGLVTDAGAVDRIRAGVDSPPQTSSPSASPRMAAPGVA